MRQKIIPVILAAGEGKRFQVASKKHPNYENFSISNKSLVKLDSIHTPLNILIYQLKKMGFKKVILIGGYNFESIRKYIDDIEKNSEYFRKYGDITPSFFKENITLIKAEPDYVKGPVFTLVSLLKHTDTIHTGEKNFIIIPSDTVFRYSILNRIIQTIIKTYKNTLNSEKHEIINPKSNIMFFTEKKHWKRNMFPKFLIPVAYLNMEQLRFIKKYLTKQRENVSKLTELIIKSPELTKISKIISIYDELYRSDYESFIDIDTPEEIPKFQNFPFLN